MEIIALIAVAIVFFQIRSLSKRLSSQEGQILHLTNRINEVRRSRPSQQSKFSDPPSSESEVVSTAAAKVPLGENAPLAQYAKSAALRSANQKVSTKPTESVDIWERPAPSSVDETVPPPAEKSVIQSETKPETEPSADKEFLGAEEQQSGQRPREPVSGGTDHSAWESLIGGQWAVWIGGIALALGGIFLVRYSIEAGLLGPKVRLTFATLFGLALLAAGEFIRRRSIDFPITKIDSAYVPGILTSVGSMVLFAVIYAAYAVYGFIGPTPAFALLGAVSFATLALALLHGPSLAALGLLASYVTPVLVSTSKPNYAALVIFLLVVTAAALALARLRQWVWLVVASAVGALVWALLLITAGDHELLNSLSLKVYLIILGAGYSAFGFVWNGTYLAPPMEVSPDDPEEDQKRIIAGYDPAGFTPFLAAILAAVGLVIVFYAKELSYTPAAIAVAALVIISIWIIAWLRLHFAVMFSIGAAIGLFIFAGWSFVGVQLSAAELSMRTLQLSFSSTLEPAPFYSIVSLVFVMFCMIAGTAGILRMTHKRCFDPVAIWWALPAAFVPVAAYMIFWVSTGTLGSVTLLVLGALGTGVLGTATELVLRRATSLTSKSMTEIMPLTYMAGSAALMAVLTLFLYFDGAMLVVLLSVLALAVSGLSVVRPVQVLRYSAAGAVAIAVVRVVIDPALDLMPSPRIIFNSLLPAYGLPVLALGAASWLLGKQAKDAPQRFMEGAAVLFGALLFTLEIRHGMNGGNIYSTSYTLGEQAAHTITALIMSGAMMRLDDRSPSIVFRSVNQLLGYLSLAMVIFSHGLYLNPIVTNEATGSGRLFNLLLIAYLLPGLIAATVHWLARSRRPIAYVTTLEATAWLLLTAFVGLTIRRIFAGQHIGVFSNYIELGEAYTHSIAALVIILVVAFAYGRLYLNWKGRVLPFALVSAIALFVNINFIFYMPYQYGLFVGNTVIFNLLLPGYLVPAVLLLALRHAWESVDDWPFPQLLSALGGLALISTFAWITLTVRHAWHGSNLYSGPFFEVETYSYSAIWLIFGVAILLLSGWRNERDLRIASAVVILASVLKVFLLDMSALEGVLRAFSFIGLGIVLIGIGLFYQRLLFRESKHDVLADVTSTEGS